jgi:uncharacterized membrane protein HdeD (DUF308 family)
MPWSDPLPNILTAVVGSAGVITGVARLAQLSEPSRLRRSLAATAALRDSMPESPGRNALDLAIERDTLRLASMSLIQNKTAHGERRNRWLFVASILLVVLGTLVYASLTLTPEFDPDAPRWVSRALLTVYIADVILLGVVIFMSVYTAAVTIRGRREHLAAQMFADGHIDAEYVRSQSVWERARSKSGTEKPKSLFRQLLRRIATWLRGSGPRRGRATAPRDGQRE